MEIKRLEDKNFKNLVEFCKIYMPNSFVYDENFLKYWFLDKHNNWLIDVVIRKNKIISANFKIENIALLNRKKCNFIWTSTALTSLQNKKDPNMGLILFNIHRSADVVGAISPNKNSIKLNSNLGIKIKNINLQRYIFLHDHNFIKILKVNKKKLFKNKKIISLKKNNKIKSSWVSVIPKDYNNLWKKFSNKFYLCINKDLDYMKKRYLKNPFIKYNFLKIENLNKKLIGFSVVRFQTQKNIIFARIIEFISTNNNEINVWNEILYRNSQYGASLSDFFVVGNNQNQNLKKIGFNKMTKYNIYYNIPNLLSPLNYRHWTNNFHLGGLMINKNDQKNLRNIWFTKGDGDRDHPTNYDIKKN